MKEVCVSRTEDEKNLDRRNFLKCMAWMGTGAVWTLSSGILKGSPLGQSAGAPMMSHDDGALRRLRAVRSPLQHRLERDIRQVIRDDMSRAPEPEARDRCQHLPLAWNRIGHDDVER